MSLFAYKTLHDLKTFHDFLQQCFKDYPKYGNMLPISNQPDPMYGYAKTQKFEFPGIVITEQLKF